MRFVLLIAAALAGSLVVVPSSRAQLDSAEARPDPTDHATAPDLLASPVVEGIVIDGVLDEDDWSRATPVTGFRQRDPDEGSPATERTEIRALLGPEDLYFGARLFDRDPSRISARVSRRDGPPDFDWLVIYLDPRHDHREAVWFSLNPTGSKADAILTPDGESDLSWDPVWEGAARVDSGGWTAEMRIPLAALRFAPGDTVWGVQLMRFVHRKQELTWWAFSPKSEPEGPSRFGHLRGLEDVSPSLGLEIVPYASVRSGRASAGAPADTDAGAGLDLRAPLSDALILDATVNPDFGQVEVDPAVINLTAFETFFPERRPFFVESAPLFAFADLRATNTRGFHEVFHSRRIGRSPRFPPGEPEASEIEIPLETTIAAAAKVTGSLGNDWRLGVLDAVTTPEDASFRDATGDRREIVVEPATNYLVARARRDLRGGRSTAGAIVTAVDRRLDDADLGARLPSGARVLGLDLEHSWNERSWWLSARAAASRVEGELGAIEALQRSSARYYQRPDAGHVEVDTSARELSGHTAQIAIAREAGDHWLGSLAFQQLSPGYETNDAGFLTITDRRMASTFIRYKEDRPSGIVRRWSSSLSGNHNWNFDGDRVGAELGLAAEAELRSYWRLEATMTRSFRRLDDRLTRGGPIARVPARSSARLAVSTDVRASRTMTAAVAYDRDEAGGRLATAELEAVLRPSPAARLSIGPRWTRRHDVAQYVATIEDATASPTFGARYVFSDLDQTEVALVGRVAWAFRPTLTLDAFAQLLVGANRFSAFKELRGPRSFDFDVYGSDRGTIAGTETGLLVDPDAAGPASPFELEDPTFTLRSLVANVVLRWEFRPGSTLFVVWQHDREGRAPEGDLDLARDLADLADAPSGDSLIVKASWWFGD